jgi:hypothetical protein
VRPTTVIAISIGFLALYLLVAISFAVMYHYTHHIDDKVHATMFMVGSAIWIAGILLWRYIREDHEHQ